MAYGIYRIYKNYNKPWNLIILIIFILSDAKLVDWFLYGDEIYSTQVNDSIFKYTVIFLKSSEKFDMSLL